MNTTWKFKTIAIKGKDYVTINERVKCFRNSEEFDGWSIKTEILHFDADSVMIKASILDKDCNVLATGHAQEDRSSSMINKTSYVENCETSAVGRALGLLGIGIENSIATYDEVNRAIKAQEQLESESENILKEGLSVLAKCKTQDEVKEVWAAFKALQGNEIFKSKVIEYGNKLAK